MEENFLLKHRTIRHNKAKVDDTLLLISEEMHAKKAHVFEMGRQGMSVKDAYTEGFHELLRKAEWTISDAEWKENKETDSQDIGIDDLYDSLLES